MARRRRPARRAGSGSGATLASAFVLSLMLLILLFTQRQIANGVVDAFNAMTVPPGEEEPETPPSEPEEASEATETRGVGVQFYEPQPLSVEVARTKVSVAAHRAMTHVRDNVADSQAP